MKKQNWFSFASCCLAAMLSYSFGTRNSSGEIAVGWDVAVTSTGIGDGPLVGTAINPNVTILSGSATGDNDINGVIEIPDIGDGSSNNVPGAYVLQDWVIDAGNSDPFVGFEISSTSGLDLSTFELVVRRERQNTPSRVREISASFSTDGVNFSPYVYPDADGLGAVIGAGRGGVSIRDPQAIDTNVLTADELKIWNLEDYSGATQLYVKVQATYTGSSSSWNPDAVLFIDDRADLDTASPLDVDTNTNNFFLPGSSTDGLDVILSTSDKWAGGTGNWSTPGNWAAGTAPQASWDAVVSNNSSASPLTATVAANSTIRSLKINGTAGAMSVAVDPGVTLSSKTIVQVGDQGHLDLQGAIDAFSAQVFDGGLLTGDGTVNGSLKNGGNLSPGNSIGTLNVAGSFRQIDSGNLSIEIGASTNDLLDIVGDVAIAGSLDVTYFGSPTINWGDTFEFLSASEIYGEFDSVRLPTLPSDLAWGVIYEESSVSLLVTYPGDFDYDGDVDGGDYFVWATGGSPNPLSSGDLNDFQAFFGASGPPVSLAAIPEPSSLCLIIGAICLLSGNTSMRRLG